LKTLTLLLLLFSLLVGTVQIQPGLNLEPSEQTNFWLNEQTFNKANSDGSFTAIFYGLPQVFKDVETSRFRALKVTENKGVYTVQNSHVGFKFDNGTVTLYTPDLTRFVCREIWTPQIFLKEWTSLNTVYTGVKLFENNSYVKFTIYYEVYSKAVFIAEYEVNYVFRVGCMMKHEINFHNKDTPAIYRFLLTFKDVARAQIQHEKGVSNVDLAAVNIPGKWFKTGFLSERLDGLGYSIINGTGEYWVNQYLKGTRAFLSEEKTVLEVSIGDFNLKPDETFSLDPDTSTFYSDSGLDDSYIYCYDAVYEKAWNGTGFGPYTNIPGSTLFVGQYYWGGGPRSYVYRTVIQFNTTLLPLLSVITAANMSLYYYSDNSDTEFTFKIQNWTDTPPITDADYMNFENVSYYDGFRNTTNWGVSWNNITFNDFSDIKKEGYTTLMLRSSRDVSKTAPSGQEYFVWRSINYDGGSKAPKLIIHYNMIKYRVTFYLNNGAAGLFWVDGVNTVNGTQTDYLPSTIIELAAIVYNRTFVFGNFTYLAATQTTNPYNLTVTENMTVWLNFDVCAGAAGVFDVLIDYYDFNDSIANISYGIWEGHPSNVGRSASGQTFYANGTYTITRASFWLVNNMGNPNGTYVVSIYNINGTHGIDGLPLGACLAMSQPVNISDLSGTTPTLYDFEFNITERCVIETGYYCVSLECFDNSTIDGTNYIYNRGHWSNPSGIDDGNWFGYWNGWYSTQNRDVYFRVYGVFQGTSISFVYVLIPMLIIGCAVVYFLYESKRRH